MQSQGTIEERNNRLILWVSEQLSFNEPQFQHLKSEMQLLFGHTTDSELAEFIWEKLSKHGLSASIENIKKIINRLHNVAFVMGNESPNKVG